LNGAKKIFIHSNNNELKGQDLSSHFPAQDGNTYIRPGKKDHNILLNGAKQIYMGSNHSSVCHTGQGGLCSHFPAQDGHTYIRPGKKWTHNFE